MNKETILEQLKTGVVDVDFVKQNGEARHMRCTLSEDIVPAQPEQTGRPARKSNPDVQRVWDVEKSAWRSFRWDSLVEKE